MLENIFAISDENIQLKDDRVNENICDRCIKNYLKINSRINHVH